MIKKKFDQVPYSAHKTERVRSTLYIHRNFSDSLDGWMDNASLRPF